ncbi:MAG: S9 family peptidase [Acidobacteria bacterium]|nr:S9 family peptidase [Acidobacteriota bacterium]
MTSLLSSAVALASVWTLDAIMQLANPADPQLRPDGARYAYVYKGAIYTAPLAGGSAVRAAQGSRPRWIAGNRLAHLAGGQVYVEGRAVTRSPTPISGYAFNQPGDTVFYLAQQPGPAADPLVSSELPRPVRLYRQAVPGNTGAAAVSPEAWNVVSFALSPDGARAVCAVQKTPLARDVFHIDLQEITLATGAAQPLVVQTGRDADPSYSPDGRTVAFHSQGGTWNYFAARHVAIVPSGGGTVRYLTEGIPYDVFRGGNVFTWSADSRSLTYTAGHGTKDVLLRQEIESGKVKVLAERVSGAASFTPDLRTAIYLKTSPARPLEIVASRAGEEKPLTRLQDSVASLPAFGSRVVRWRASDGLPAEGMLWLPVGYREGQRVPMLVELHGGPTGVTLESFPVPRTYPTQLFLQSGIAVFSPNFRGSSNYGADFRLKNALSQGVGDYDDVMTGIDMLVKEGIADPGRLGIMGWSYGGYLSGNVITKSNRFKAASVGAPAVDWITYYGEFEGSKEVLWTYFGGTPWDVPENYIRHSTRAGLKNVRTPTLLQVGSEDINHNHEIYQALTDRGVPVEYVVYPREGHGIAEPAHQRDLMERNLRWFKRWLQVQP